MAQQRMSNTIELYEAAAQMFRQTLSGVTEDQMNSSTPCTEWNVQALITHSIKTQGMTYGGLLENITVNPHEVSGPLPAEGALATFDAGVARVLELIKAPGFLDNQIETPFGPMSRDHFLSIPVEDLVIHKWDLAKATQPGHLPGCRTGRVCLRGLGACGRGVSTWGLLRARDNATHQRQHSGEAPRPQRTPAVNPREYQ